MYKIISIAVFAVTLVAALLIGFHVVDEQMTNGEADLREYFLQDFEVRVKLEADEHCVIVSENPVTVKRGEAAQFDIVFENNYKLDEEATPDRITVSDGKLTVAD